jgi:hypothetical protein
VGLSNRYAALGDELELMSEAGELESKRQRLLLSQAAVRLEPT